MVGWTSTIHLNYATPKLNMRFIDVSPASHMPSVIFVPVVRGPCWQRAKESPDGQSSSALMEAAAIC